MDIIKKFKKMLPKISNKIVEEKKKLQKANSEGETKKQKLENTLKEIYSNQFKINNLSPKSPGFWENIIADDEPGLIKSFFLSWFVSQESINAAKKKCADYQNRMDLMEKNEELELTKKQLEEDVSDSDEDISIRTNKVGELEMYHGVLRTSIEKLEKNAIVLIPKMTADKEQKNIEQVKKPRDPDEMIFTMDL